MSSLFRDERMTFREFAKTLGSPEEAQRRLKAMVDSGQVTQSQLDQAMSQARRIASILGIGGR